MAAALEPLRPWANVADVTAALERWLHRSGWGQKARTISLQVTTAEHLRYIGRLDPDIASATIVTTTLGLLGNVLHGRDPTDYDRLRLFIQGVPDRTMRHYRQIYGTDDALDEYLGGFQHKLDVAALVHGGRTVTAARAWLRANPGKHAADAPPPRHRAA
jgi:hypothetical protein